MWNQTNLSAPWTKTDLFNTLTTILTLPGFGYAVYDDESASFKKTFRLNLGQGKDLCFKIQLTDITNGVRLQSYFFETADYSTSTHLVPSSNNNQSTIDFLFANNILVNSAVAPDKTVSALWFKTVLATTDPILFSTIDPFKQSDGATLVNSGDDGSGYPLWGSLLRGSGSSLLVSITGYIAGYYNGTTSLFLSVTRSPSTKNYLVETLGMLYAGYTSNCAPRYPHARHSAWAGLGTLVEGFRAIAKFNSLSGSNVLSDMRGHLGSDGSLLISDSFGGLPEDFFSVAEKQYRIVHVYNPNTLYGQNVYLAAIAVRVA